MHKDFYASGFLYHPKSEQILLQQKIIINGNSYWTLFTKKSTEDKSGEESFNELLHETLNLDLKLNKIKIIYSYVSKELNKQNIYYAEVKSLQKYPVSENTTFTWFTFKQIHKINVSEQTKHDIIVGQRVIDSNMRRDLGERTIG